jgi:hypothetical protein
MDFHHGIVCASGSREKSCPLNDAILKKNDASCKSTSTLSLPMFQTAGLGKRVIIVSEASLARANSILDERSGHSQIKERQPHPRAICSMTDELSKFIRGKPAAAVFAESEVKVAAIPRNDLYTESPNNLTRHENPLAFTSGGRPPSRRPPTTFQTAGLGSKIAVSAANLARADIILHAETKMMEQAKVIEALKEENEILQAERLTWTVKESEDESSEDEDKTS